MPTFLEEDALRPCRLTSLQAAAHRTATDRKRRTLLTRALRLADADRGITEGAEQATPKAPTLYAHARAGIEKALTHSWWLLVGLQTSNDVPHMKVGTFMSIAMAAGAGAAQSKEDAHLIKCRERGHGVPLTQTGGTDRLIRAAALWPSRSPESQQHPPQPLHAAQDEPDARARRHGPAACARHPSTSHSGKGRKSWRPEGPEFSLEKKGAASPRFFLSTKMAGKIRIRLWFLV